MTTGITTPPDGATLRGAIQVFDWEVDAEPVESAFLYVGSPLGGSQYGSRNLLAGGAANRGRIPIGSLPTDRSTVHARLWYRTGGLWRFADQQYTAAGAANQPRFTEPAPGRLIGDSTQTFRWDVADLQIDGYWLYVGSTPGGSDYALTPRGSESRSATVTSLPTDGGTIHVRLFFVVAGTWFFVDDSFETASVAPPSRDELTRELQRLVGATPDGVVGRRTRAALNRNWLGRPAGFDRSFAERFVNDADLVRWVQRRINSRTRTGLAENGTYDRVTEAAVVEHLGRSGVVAAESYLALLDAD
jgi:hypothetical protein